MVYDVPARLIWPKGQGDEARVPHGADSARRRMRLVARFGRFAAAGSDDVQALLDEACCVAADGLASGFAKLLVYLPGERAFVLQAGVGWHDGLVGHARLDADIGTAAGFAWHSGRSVVSNDIVAEGRFRVPPILVEHGIGSSINVVVPTAGGDDEAAFGVLEVEGPGRGDFTADDVCFLQAIAHSLAAALGRRAQRLLHEEQAAREALHHQLSLREVHHRVHNDLQGLRSSVGVEARRTADRAQREGFGRISGRVLALAGLYDQLLGASVADEVELGAYLRALCGRIAEAGGLESRSIELRVEVEAVTMPRGRALPLAVAVNELVSNAAEHAFVGRRFGRITVGLLAAGEDGRCGPVVTVADDVCGFDGPRPDGVGLGFVERLVQHAGGMLGRDDDGGTRWHIALSPEQGTKGADLGGLP
jgi:two-component sensor histidine kinase/putative methionine-R-sulfoxide reductase with GAF domain